MIESRKTEEIGQPKEEPPREFQPRSSVKFQVEAKGDPEEITEARQEVNELRKSTSIKNRLTYFEVSSLVRSARNKREEDLQEVHDKKTVRGVLGDFESNDVILAGRQIPNKEDIQMRGATVHGTTEVDGIPKDGIEGNDTDSLYASIDPNRKSVKSQRSRADSDLEKCDSVSEASTASVPELPRKD